MKNCNTRNCNYGETAGIQALSSGKIDKYQYLTGEEMLPSNQKQIIEQAKFTNSPLEKALEKQTFSNKTDELRQVEGIFPKNLLNDLIISKLEDLIKLKDIIKLNKLVYESKRFF